MHPPLVLRRRLERGFGRSAANLFFGLNIGRIYGTRCTERHSSPNDVFAHGFLSLMSMAGSDESNDLIVFIKRLFVPLRVA